MIVKLEDFEKYRNSLLIYSKYLLIKYNISKRFDEYREISKDLAQDSYIQFQNSKILKFDNELHFSNFLKLCLYRRFQDYSKTSSIYNYRKKRDKLEISLLNEDKHPEIVYFYSEDDIISLFKEKLNNKEGIILELLLLGLKQKEIAKELNIKPNCIFSHIKRMRTKYNKWKLIE